MKIKITSVLLLAVINSFAQSGDSLSGFDAAHLNEHLLQIKDPQKKADLEKSVRRSYIKQKYNLLPETYFPYGKVDSTAGCGNLDFENGDVSGWTIAGDYQLMSGSGYDPYGGYPVSCPGGNFSLRLNDNNTTSKVNFTSSARHAIAVTSSNAIIKVNFAADIFAFPHPANAAGLMKIEFLDASNNVIPTQSLSVYYSTPPGAMTGSSSYFTSYATGVNIGNQSYPVYCVPWQAASYNLSAYIGQNVTIRLTANWCLYNYDWTYAYFDVCCSAACPSPPFISAGGALCSSFPNTICAPANLINCSWSGSSGPISTGSCATVSSPGTYTLSCNPASSPSTMLSYVYTINPVTAVSFSVPPLFCTNSPSITLTASPSGGFFTGPVGAGNTFDPTTLSPATYSLNYYYSDVMAGCSSITTQTTTVSTCTGVKELNTTIGSCQVFPNPFSNTLFLSGKELPGSEFVLFNSLGQEIFRKKLEATTLSFSPGELPKGIYIYTLIHENQLIKTGKLIRE